MIFNEVKKDLFAVDDKYYLAHCISADAKMGAGIAVEFTNKFPNIKYLRLRDNRVTEALLVDRVFNLITKQNYYGKPTYNTLKLCILKMRDICEYLNIKYIAMPKIGCGLDRLSWGMVRDIIKEVFKDTDVEILVCSV